MSTPGFFGGLISEAETALGIGKNLGYISPTLPTDLSSDVAQFGQDIKTLRTYAYTMQGFQQQFLNRMNNSQLNSDFTAALTVMSKARTMADNVLAQANSFNAALRSGQNLPSPGLMAQYEYNKVTLQSMMSNASDALNSFKQEVSDAWSKFSAGPSVYTYATAPITAIASVVDAVPSAAVAIGQDISTGVAKTASAVETGVQNTASGIVGFAEGAKKYLLWGAGGLAVVGILWLLMDAKGAARAAGVAVKAVS